MRRDTIIRIASRALPVLEISRFAVVGCANTLIDFAVFWLLARGLDLPIVAANIGAWTVAFTFSFVANGRWTFGRAWALLLRPSYYARFALASLGSPIVTTAVLLIATTHMKLAIAKILSIAAGFILNFAVAKLVPVRWPLGSAPPPGS